MNMNRLINRGLRMLMNKGINKGVQMASHKGKKPEDMTPEERAAARQAQQNAQKARRGLGLARRFLR
ncbi:hypothetical protein [Yoonia litorea]|uniref:Uncharacterized protein n=1 Tax=Yoonia litorea TaxID=1123755 RepID=A0A1I6LZH0_9RHOB|nr:hypothetical protein [Yoonia litorea]SFS08778.1 hypothetical protein SAMN05444714_1053 [Yoonia litorea]